MAKRKRMSEGKKNIIAALLGDTIKEMMGAEIDEHLGYESYERSNNPNSRNGYKQKQILSKYGNS